MNGDGSVYDNGYVGRDSCGRSSPFLNYDNRECNVNTAGYVDNYPIDWDSGGKIDSPNVNYDNHVYYVYSGGDVYDRWFVTYSYGRDSPDLNIYHNYNILNANYADDNGISIGRSREVYWDSGGNKITLTNLIRILKFDKYKLTAE